MSKPIWGGSDNLESELFPDGYGRLVGTHDQVKLHSDKSPFFCQKQRVLAQLGANSFTLGLRVYHVGGIRNVASSVDMVGFQNIGPENLALLFGHEGLHFWREPVFLQVGLWRIGGEDIGISGLDHLGENLPDGLMVAGMCLSNIHTVKVGK